LTYFLVVCFGHVLVVSMADIACVVQDMRGMLVYKVLTQNFMIDACDDFLHLPEVRQNYRDAMAVKHAQTIIL
jgi:hypothetical protein